MKMYLIRKMGYYIINMVAAQNRANFCRLRYELLQLSELAFLHTNVQFIHFNGARVHFFSSCTLEMHELDTIVAKSNSCTIVIKWYPKSLHKI